jgi:hypothetical protein
VLDERHGTWDVLVSVWGKSTEGGAVGVSVAFPYLPTSLGHVLSAPMRRPEPGPPAATLGQNYPNPYNPETWIPFAPGKEAEVVIRIYDTRGALVRRLSPGRLPAGNYSDRGRAVHWVGRNSLGERVPSGVYFYYLTAGEFAATRRLLITK